MMLNDGIKVIIDLRAKFIRVLFNFMIIINYTILRCYIVGYYNVRIS